MQLSPESTRVGRVRRRLHEMFAGETPTPRRETIAYSGASLYGPGATLVLVSLALERNAATRLWLALAALAIAYAVTGVLILAPRLLPVGVYPYLTGLGTLLISVLAYADGNSSSSYSLLYVWVALYSFYFYSARVALLETVWVSAAAAAELVARGAPAPFSLWLLTTGTSLIGGLAIRQLVTQVRRLANHDELTGLYNRRRLEEELDRSLGLARRSGEPVSLVIIDLDCFKEFNDRHGHLAGDNHLRACARLWSAAKRATDLLVRFGGEEFILVLPRCGIGHAVETADRIRALTPNAQSASAGVVQWDGAEDWLTLIARADEALYRAKVEGRDRSAVAAPSAPAGSPTMG